MFSYLNIDWLSESKFAEEKSDVASFLVCFGIWQVSVGLGESFFNLLLEKSFGLSTLKRFLLDLFEIEVIDNESGGHNVILVNIFNEGLDSGLLDELLFVNGPFDLLGVSGDADQQKMRESVLLNIVTVVLCFPPRSSWLRRPFFLRTCLMWLSQLFLLWIYVRDMVHSAHWWFN